MRNSLLFYRTFALVLILSISMKAQTGSSISFDGSNDYATVPNNSALEFTTGTIEFWVKPGTFSGNAAMVALRDAADTRFSLHMASDLNSLGMWNGASYTTVTVNLNSGTWYHVAYVFKNSDTDVYVDGVYQGTLNLAALNTGVTGKDLTLGQSGTNGEYFGGEIDELRFWDEERSASEIDTYKDQILGGMEENLIAYYKFDEGSGTTSVNKVGSTVGDITFQNETSWGTNTTGVSDPLAKAVNFDGDGDYVSVEYNSSLDFSTGTVEFWMKAQAGHNQTHTLVAMREGTTRFHIVVQQDLNVLGLWNGLNYNSTTASITADTWTHIAYVFGASTTEIYVNGSSIGTLPNTINTGVTGRKLYFGQNGDNGEYFKGAIDEIRIWNDERTSQEILDNYQAELNGSQPNLIAYYRMNEGSGTSTKNWLQNGILSGVLNGNSAWGDHDWLISEPTETTASQPAGSGTEADPYLISNLAELRWVSENAGSWASYFKQTADIDASETVTWNDSLGFSPIGFQPTYFKGNYDGNSKIIDGLTINRPGVQYVGLFSFPDNSPVIKNLGLTNVDITAAGPVGALTGTAYGAYIANCFATGSVTSTNYYISGDTKYASAGGLVGGIGTGTVVEFCYSRVNVTAEGLFVGGLVGSDFSGTGIHFSYSTGVVVHTGDDKRFVGGLTGSGRSNTFNSFWDTEASGMTTSLSGTGLTTTDMKTISTFINASWDFEVETENGTNNYWEIDPSGVKNDGYPFLAWENGETVVLPVELSAFTASVNGSSVELKWNTATELNNYGFQVERASTSSAIDKKTWVVIGFVDGHGTTNTPQSYSFIDSKTFEAFENPAGFDGTIKYRLKQIDFDGKFEYSDVAEIELGTPEKFELMQNYPNPFNPTTTIKFNIPVTADHVSPAGRHQSARTILRIYNALGEQVSELLNQELESGFHSVEFDASNLASGLYLYSITSGDFVRTKKMLLLK
ncbi:MAG: T9SS type A sorting domain-containing protein [Melioribacteraceae bacterium]|nr:T9SS type A sorting domain-containing protein [Melioribacteraceae bacterium]MCF8263046.1 T9SS type A sorting domain-containing protein [Melioribacteraceae bacterium]MCF8432143.1 T9SS type A sorting domain-containing protein [Melioribacteraceae bacterium]